MAELKQMLLTAEGKAQLEAMLPTLIAQKREIKERLQGTKTYGDAKLVDPSLHDGTVQIGSCVTIVDDTGEVETWTIVAPAEASTRNRKISDQSPMGAAMIGKVLGDEIRVRAPGGDMVYTIRTIE